MKNKIIVAPLNWGLGHASRCVPIIHFLVENNFTPVIASDGNALELLQKEFPGLEFLDLPSYGISYAKNLKLGLLFQFPKVLRAIKNERKVIANYLEQDKEVVGIISDNRLGVRNSKIPSVYLTHQVNVLAGFVTFISSKIHQFYIKKFDECWVPDTKDNLFSGALSKTNNQILGLKYIGVLSRFKKGNLPIINDVLILLSGIESQRKSLEDKLLSEFANYQGRVVVVQGLIENKQTIIETKGIKMYNYLLSSEVEKEIKQSQIVVCRSGYSSIMDLAVLDKKAIFIPTPNQPEQEYLASYLEGKKMAPFSLQNELTKEKIKVVSNYKGLSSEKTLLDPDLLCLFKRK